MKARARGLQQWGIAAVAPVSDWSPWNEVQQPQLLARTLLVPENHAWYGLLYSPPLPFIFFAPLWFLLLSKKTTLGHCDPLQGQSRLPWRLDSCQAQLVSLWQCLQTWSRYNWKTECCCPSCKCAVLQVSWSVHMTSAMNAIKNCPTLEIRKRACQTRAA